MAHTIYTTDAFVLGGTAVGEANRYVALLTCDFGLLRAVAKSVRQPQSKLRYGLQDYTRAHISLVRGREVWRVVGVQDASNPALWRESASTRELLARLSSLLRRLMQGEEAQPAVFHALAALLLFMDKRSLLSNEALAGAESITVLRILYHLGYLAPISPVAQFLDGDDITDELVHAAMPLRRNVIETINQSLAESQL